MLLPINHNRYNFKVPTQNSVLKSQKFWKSRIKFQGLRFDFPEASVEFLYILIYIFWGTDLIIYYYSKIMAKDKLLDTHLPLWHKTTVYICKYFISRLWIEAIHPPEAAIGVSWCRDWDNLYQLNWASWFLMLLTEVLNQQCCTCTVIIEYPVKTCICSTI